VIEQQPCHRIRSRNAHSSGYSVTILSRRAPEPSP
jgi:hypothetical protein